MACETAKDAWDKLKEEFQGSERTRQMQVLNLRREFEALKMKDTDTVKEFSDKLMKVVNQVRLLGEELSDARVVEKVLVSLPERFEPKISSLEDSEDLAKITLSELVNALQASEQRRTLRLEENTEGAFLAKQKGKAQASSGEKKPSGERKDKEKKDGDRKGKFPPCSHCKKTNHKEKYCWFRPGIPCRVCQKFGHVEKVCKNKGEQQNQQAQVAENKQQEEKLVHCRSEV